MVWLPHPVGACLPETLFSLIFNTMDTIIERNEHLYTSQHAVLPPAVPKSRLRYFFRRKKLQIEEFVLRWFCCANSTLVADWEFDEEVRQNIHAMHDDDVDFQDIVNCFNAAADLEARQEQRAILRVAGVQLAREGANDSVTLYAGSRTPQVPHCSLSQTSEERMADALRKGIVARGVRSRRRRKRVVAYVVVALINKVRCKYYHLEHTPANKRLVGSYLLKLMREHNFRTCDIHLHVDYAVDLYFELSGSDVKTTVYARC